MNTAEHLTLTREERRDILKEGYACLKVFGLANTEQRDLFDSYLASEDIETHPNSAATAWINMKTGPKTHMYVKFIKTPNKLIQGYKMDITMPSEETMTLDLRYCPLAASKPYVCGFLQGKTFWGKAEIDRQQSEINDWANEQASVRDVEGKLIHQSECLWEIRTRKVDYQGSSHYIYELQTDCESAKNRFMSNSSLSPMWDGSPASLVTEEEAIAISSKSLAQTATEEGRLLVFFGLDEFSTYERIQEQLSKAIQDSIRANVPQYDSLTWTTNIGIDRVVLKHGQKKGTPFHEILFADSQVANHVIGFLEAQAFRISEITRPGPRGGHFNVGIKRPIRFDKAKDNRRSSIGSFSQSMGSNGQSSMAWGGSSPSSAAPSGSTTVTSMDQFVQTQIDQAISARQSEFERAQSAKLEQALKAMADRMVGIEESVEELKNQVRQDLVKLTDGFKSKLNSIQEAFNAAMGRMESSSEDDSDDEDPTTRDPEVLLALLAAKKSKVKEVIAKGKRKKKEGKRLQAQVTMEVKAAVSQVDIDITETLNRIDLPRAIPPTPPVTHHSITADQNTTNRKRDRTVDNNRLPALEAGITAPPARGGANLKGDQAVKLRRSDRLDSPQDTSMAKA